MRYVGSGLDKLRDSREPSAPEKPAIKTFTELVAEMGGRAEHVAAAHVLVCQVEDDRDAGSVAATSMLSSEIVAAGQGEAAFRALRSHFQQVAASDGSSTVAQWLQALRDEHLELIADSGGPAGQRLTALRNVEEANLERYKSEKGKITLSLFADDLPPLFVPNLLECSQIFFEGPSQDRPSTVNLASFARTIPKFVLDGLPGAGKSTSLHQLAADWAIDSSCTTPLFVELRQLASTVTRSTDVTLRLLIQTALKGLDGVTDAVIDEKMSSLSRDDHWTLILDGLDETLSKRGLITDGLRILIASMPRTVGFILATRHTAIPAVRKLGLPVVNLDTPERFETVLDNLIDHVAENRLKEPDWAAARKAWLSGQLKLGHPLWQVPLTATLMTLAACDDAGFEMSNNKGLLFRSGIENAVRRWELTHKPTDELEDSQLNAQILIFVYTFVCLSAALESRVEMESLVQRVSNDLRTELEVPRMQSRQVAEAAMNFWIEQMGSFVLVEKSLEPRHRQIAEVGDAMWVCAQARERQLEWLGEALADDVSSERVELAIHIQPDMLKFLSSLATEDAFDFRLRALEWTLLFSRSAVGSMPADMDCMSLMEAAQEAARAGSAPQRNEPDAVLTKLRDYVVRTGATTGSRWYWAYALASFPAPNKELQSQKWRMLDDLEFSEDQKGVLSLLSVLSQRREGAPFDTREQELIMTVLSNAVPAVKSYLDS